MRKKLFRFAALAVFICAVFSACTVKSADDYDANDKYTDEVVTGSGTFSGTFRIKTEATDTLSLDPTVYGSTVRGDEILKRYKDVADRFSCDIKAEQVKPGVIMTTMMASTAAARTFADIFQLSAGNIYTMYKGGYLTYAQNLSSVDITSEKWGTDGQKELMTFEDGKTYGIRNVYWAAPIQSVSGVLYYNSDLITKNNAVLPAEYAENDKWNWDKFRDICVTVTQNIEDKQGTYAFAKPTAEYPAFLHAAIASNSGERLIKKSTGYECGYEKTNTIEALEWIKRLVVEDKLSYTLREDTLTDLDIEAFVNFYTVFLVSDTSAGISDKENYPLFTFGENFRWIEFPQGPSFKGATTAYYSENDWFLAISNTIDTDKGGQIIDALFEPLNENEDWQDFVSKNYFFYDEDFDMYEKMISNAKSDGSVFTQNSNLTENDILAAVADGQKTPKEAAEMLAPVIEGLAG